MTIMESLLVLFAILIVSSSVSRSEAETSKVLNRYVTPSRMIGCFNDQIPCNTIEEYASQPDTYFTNNTHFYFQPGSHQLNNSIQLRNIQNLTFQGLSGGEIVKVLFGSYVNITWEKCSNIQVSSIAFTLFDNFNFSIVFRKTQLVHLSDISVVGSEYIGCSSLMSLQSTVSINNSKFVGIHGWVGAALRISKSTVTFIGNNTFIDNVASAGGCVYMLDSVLMLNGNNLFMNNTSHRQGRFFDENVCIDYHSYYSGGGAISCLNSTVIVNSNNYSTQFIRNIAGSNSGGAISAQNCRIFIGGFTSFHSNSAHVASGGAMVLEDVNLEFCGNISLENNSATYGGALHISNTNISFNMNDIALMTCHSSETSVTFRQNKATQVGGAIESHFNNILIFTGKVVFIDNSAFNGGAIASFQTSSLKMILVPILNISFLMNHASDTGGALYFRDSLCLIGSRRPLECFLSVMNHSSCAIRENILLLFEHNSAGSVGSTLYGGYLSECRLYFRNSYKLSLDNICDTKLRNDYYSADALGVFMSISRIIQYEESVTNISSPANELNICDQHWWPSRVYKINVHPGAQFNIPLKAIAQKGYAVPANILIDNSYSMGDRYRISPLNQNINATCTNASFQLYSSREEEHVSITLYPENPCHSLVEGIQLSIYILPCPIGFQLSNNHGKCVCNKKVQKFTPNCYIDDTSFERIRNNFWISQTYSTELIIHEFRCPLDYCTNSPVNVTVMYNSDQSVQCDFNRNGTVCGQCLKNFSLALGSLHCIPCDNNHAALIVFFAFAGIALVTLIFLLRLTVAVGTLNGLLFYANIIQANQQAFFPRATINPFTIFIAWLNLDLGIETCFYEGMDIYAYSWLKFLFPFYVWFLIGCIIVACRYCRSIAKLFGQNPAAVLATLLLMSYSKILSGTISPLSWTYLTYYSPSNEYHRVVWLYDGSIEFFKEPKHIALGLFAIFSLVVFVIPYIFLLLFGQWLQGCSNWWILSWLNKIKPFMDAYHAPYTKHARYWTGLLLLTRLGLFLTFAINTFGSNSVNILAVSTVTASLLAIKRRVYEHWCMDILESSFILNLCIFSVVTFYLNEEFNEDIESRHNPSSVSIGVAFITFIGILLFHISLVLKSLSIWKVHMLPFIQKSLFLSTMFRITPVKDNTTTGDSKTTELHVLPTSTGINVDLREPLLESQHAN